MPKAEKKKQTPKQVKKTAPKKIAKASSKATQKPTAKKSAVGAKKLMTLFGYWRSGASWRVRLTLFLKGFKLDKDIEYIPVNLIKDGGEQFKEDYVKLNPAKMVPTLVLRDPKISKTDIIMQESLPICEFLEEVYPNRRKLIPKGAIQRHQMRRLCEIINSNTQPVQNLSILNEVGNRFGAEHKMPWGKWAVNRGLGFFDKAIAKTKGKYCMGNAITLADVFLVSQLANAARFEVDMTQFPNIVAVNENLKNIPEFKAAHPTAQPDAVLPPPAAK